MRSKLIVLIFLALVWAILTNGEGWWLWLLLLPILLLWLKHYPLPLPVLHWRFLPSFLSLFFKQLVLGAVDVARRALAANADCEPGFVRYPLRLQQPEHQLLLMTLVSLLPGTYAVACETESDAGFLELHILDIKSPWQSEVAQCEWQLGRLLGENLQEHP